jgi:hypothetical protein
VEAVGQRSPPTSNSGLERCQQHPPTADNGNGRTVETSVLKARDRRQAKEIVAEKFHSDRGRLQKEESQNIPLAPDPAA